MVVHDGHFGQLGLGRQGLRLSLQTHTPVTPVTAVPWVTPNLTQAVFPNHAVTPGCSMCREPKAWHQQLLSPTSLCPAPEPKHPKLWPGSQQALVSSNDNAQQASSPGVGVSRIQGVPQITIRMRSALGACITKHALISRAPSTLYPHIVAPGVVGAVSPAAWAQCAPWTMVVLPAASNSCPRL